ncbi:hypothetical protein GGX14DRAFT_566450 [Mycena pura]|uniref:Uncharacterized protein n=1 Tax=Mycena pura TaxID=153505 RepID=A0AAD6YB27_9AGAR|nr:hypothetical protein GGX14DRAFT_566450 [Mycena pura]
MSFVVPLPPLEEEQHENRLSKLLRNSLPPSNKLHNSKFIPIYQQLCSSRGLPHSSRPSRHPPPLPPPLPTACAHRTRAHRAHRAAPRHTARPPPATRPPPPAAARRPCRPLPTAHAPSAPRPLPAACATHAPPCASAGPVMGTVIPRHHDGRR